MPSSFKIFLLGTVVVAVCFFCPTNSLGIKGRPCNRLRKCESVLNGPKLSCNIWDEEKGEKCLLTHGEECKSDSDCTNNLMCDNDKCSCDVSLYWNAEKSYCVRKADFGDVCDEEAEVDECEAGLICATSFAQSNTTTCLKDVGMTCGANTDCANDLFCINGECTCNVGEPRVIHNTTEHTCQLINPAPGAECKSDTDCGSPVLACDNNANESVYPLTHTCLSTFGSPCLNTYECANNLVCNLESNLCECDEGFYYANQNTCNQERQFQERCTNSAQCEDVLECNSIEATNQQPGTCLKPNSYECEQDSECVNNLNCTSVDVCGCGAGYTYVEALTTCVLTLSRGQFGNACTSQANCTNGLVCSTLGTYVGVCLYDTGAKCSTTNDCANLLTCQFDGTCGCNVIETSQLIKNGAQPFVYNSTTRSCQYAYTFANERTPCASNPSVCYTESGSTLSLLQCDSKTEQATNVCLRSYFLPCLLDTDCYGNLVCDQTRFRCLCDLTTSFLSFAPGKIIETQCEDFRLFKENCTSYDQCLGELVCSTRGKETGNDAYTCRQPFGASCESNSDCANSLDCVEDTHLCGCNEGSYYVEATYECSMVKGFGEKCASDEACFGNRACDTNPVGASSFTCSLREGAKCASSNDCVNNLDCIKGSCGCSKGTTYDAENALCSTR